MTEQLPPVRERGPASPRNGEPPAGLPSPPGQQHPNRPEAAAEETLLGRAVEPDGEYDEGAISDRLMPDAGYVGDQDGEAEHDEDYDEDYEDEDEDYDEDYDDAEQRDLEADEAYDDESRMASPAMEWLSVVGLIAGGVIGGAVVWLGFDWLWGVLPAAALVAALVVIVAMVWIVRKIRHADDPQTSVLAVLVGLVVTVSPAALLLLKR